MLLLKYSYLFTCDYSYNEHDSSISTDIIFRSNVVFEHKFNEYRKLVHDLLYQYIFLFLFPTFLKGYFFKCRNIPDYIKIDIHILQFKFVKSEISRVGIQLSEV